MPKSFNKINATFLVSFKEDELIDHIEFTPQIVNNASSVVIIGSGPADYLQLLEHWNLV